MPRAVARGPPGTGLQGAVRSTFVTKHVIVITARTYGTGAVDPDPSVVAAPWQGYPALLGQILPLVLMAVFCGPFSVSHYTCLS